jgi:hypothetical protein
MANAAQLKGRTPYRAFHIGFPGSGKTGALAALANAGYKLRIIDFEGNYQPLVEYVDERALANIDIVTLQDKMRSGDKYVEASGIPEAFNKALTLMQHWKYKDEDGTEVDLGKSSEWGLDTIVVVDSMSSGGTSAKLRAMKMNNKTPANMTSAVWGHAVADWSNFIEIMKADRNRFHLIINSHKQILGPADFLNQNDDKEGNEALKEQKMEMIRDGMIPSRIYPVSVTKPNAQVIHGMLPIMLEFLKTTKQGKDMRVINTVGGMEIDLKIPSRSVKATYPIETGLAEIFEALGYKAPGFK